MNRRSFLLGSAAAIAVPALPPNIFTAAVEKSRDCGMIPCLDSTDAFLVGELERLESNKFFLNPIWAAGRGTKIAPLI